MGLYAEFTVQQMGFPTELNQTVLGEDLWVEVDYSQALQDAVDTFLSIATDLVPVDTGYLQSTIDAGCDDTSAWFEAYAEYAQYPEFGTWCQDAQPYFRPALDEAVAVFGEGATEAYDWAQEEMQNLIDDVISAAQEAAMAEMGPDFGSYMIGTLAAVALLFIAFPLLVNLYGIMDTIGNSMTGGGSYANFGSGSSVDIIIT